MRKRKNQKNEIYKKKNEDDNFTITETVKNPKNRRT